MRWSILHMSLILFLVAGVSFGQEGLSSKAREHLARGIEAIEAASSPDEYDSAVSEFEEAVRLAPESAEVHYYLGRVLSMVKGQAGRAIKELERYLELSPDAPDREEVKGMIRELEDLKNTTRKAGSLGFIPVVLSDGVYIKYKYPFRVGIRVDRGDKITAIDGVSTRGMSLGEFLDRLDGEPGTYVELDIVRAGERKHIRLKRPSRKFMTGFRELGDDYFDDMVKGTDRPLIAVFWAPWCKPCKQMSRMMIRMGLLGDRATLSRTGVSADRVPTLVSISVEEHPELTDRYSIKAIPTTLFFKKGVPVDRHEGGNPQKFAKAVMNFIKSYDTYSVMAEDHGYGKKDSTNTGIVRAIPSAKRQSAPVGMMVRPAPDGIHVVGVRPGSPAEKAGVREGDIVKEVDGKRLENISIKEFVEMLDGPPGTKVELLLYSRGDQRHVYIERLTP